MVRLQVATLCLTRSIFKFWRKTELDTFNRGASLSPTWSFVISRAFSSKRTIANRRGWRRSLRRRIDVTQPPFDCDRYLPLSDLASSSEVVRIKNSDRLEHRAGLRSTFLEKKTSGGPKERLCTSLRSPFTATTNSLQRSKASRQGLEPFSYHQQPLQDHRSHSARTCAFLKTSISIGQDRTPISLPIPSPPLLPATTATFNSRYRFFHPPVAIHA